MDRKRDDGEMGGTAGRPAGNLEFFAVDVFCGAGGTTRGLIDAGGYVVAGIDKDARCRQTYIENNRNRFLDNAPPEFLHRDIFPADKRHPGGQQAALIEDLDRIIPRFRKQGWRVPWLFAICAPCQPFTRLARKELSRKRKVGRQLDRHLLCEAVKLVERYMPELVLSENVQGIGDPKYGGVWEDFRQSLEALGYVTGAKVVCTSRFGIPQYRKRSILLAVRRDVAREDRYVDSKGVSLLVPEADPDASTVSVCEAIGHLPPIKAGVLHPEIPNHRARDLSLLNQRRLAAAKPGQSNAYMADTPNGDLSLKCHRRVNRKLGTRCFTDVYTRMHPDRPSPTITTKCHSISNGRFGHYDVKQRRGISLREAAILQSFPEDYVFYPTHQIEPIARMIGNAVPPKLASFYCRYLVRSIEPAVVFRGRTGRTSVSPRRRSSRSVPRSS
ncbi:MAG: DNA cytosine methyltransferase [Deltaproteobacteria bacterium]|nr:DNA cytosine methyltransferase [Deltaproteobacteria bacterium]